MMKILSVSADLFTFQSNLDFEKPVAIRIRFSNNSAVRVRCSSDGESVTVDDQALDGSVDMGVDGGIEVRDITERVDDKILRSDITSVNDVLDENDSVVGLAFNTNYATILCVWNYGDELHYGDYSSMTGHDWGAALRVSEKRCEFLSRKLHMP